MSALPASAYPSAAAIARVCAAAEARGMKVVRFRVEPGGAIEVWDAAALPAGPPATTADEIEEWRKGKRK